MIRKLRITVTDGKRYAVQHHNLDAIISVGYRVNSVRATRFRQWATSVLRDFAIRGYVIDRQRMDNGAFLGEDHFERLLDEIREIRLSERRFYQKATDIYAISIDYNKDAPTKRFFAAVHNELHFLDLAQSRARRQAPRNAEDWAKRLGNPLNLDDRQVLDGTGRISKAQADEHAPSKLEEFRTTQDHVVQVTVPPQQRLGGRTGDGAAIASVLFGIIILVTLLQRLGAARPGRGAHPPHGPSSCPGPPRGGWGQGGAR